MNSCENHLSRNISAESQNGLIIHRRVGELTLHTDIPEQPGKLWFATPQHPSKDTRVDAQARPVFAVVFSQNTIDKCSKQPERLFGHTVNEHRPADQGHL